MKRKVTLKVYILAFVITAAIFLLGVYVGQLVDSKVSVDLLTEIKEYSQESVSFEIMLLMDDSSSFCPLYIEESELLEERTIELGLELTYFENVKGVYDVELKSQYFLLETKAYLLASRIKELCAVDKDIILYFYSQDCGECKEQGMILDEIVKEREGEIRVYSFDGEIGSSVVEGFKNKYSIDAYPALIVNNQIFKGFKEKEELLNILN